VQRDNGQGDGGIPRQPEPVDEGATSHSLFPRRDFALIGEPVAFAANESSDGSRALRCGFWAGGGDAANDNTKVP
jgi:hypothetical protein